jgi:ribosomal protein S18 acetylase RimI-like enzyme
MKIIEATKEDADIIFNLFSEFLNMYHKIDPVLFKSAEKNDLFYSFLHGALSNDNEKLFIGYLGDVPIGYIHIFIDQIKENLYFRARNRLYIEQLMITKKYRGNGYGKALINHVIEIAKNLKIKRVELDTLSFNQKSIEFYKHLGFDDFMEKKCLNLSINA